MLVHSTLSAGRIKCARLAAMMRAGGRFHARARPDSMRVCTLSQVMGKCVDLEFELHSIEQPKLDGATQKLLLQLCCSIYVLAAFLQFYLR